MSYDEEEIDIGGGFKMSDDGDLDDELLEPLEGMPDFGLEDDDAEKDRN